MKVKVKPKLTYKDEFKPFADKWLKVILLEVKAGKQTFYIDPKDVKTVDFEEVVDD